MYDSPRTRPLKGVVSGRVSAMRAVSANVRRAASSPAVGARRECSKSVVEGRESTYKLVCRPMSV